MAFAIHYQDEVTVLFHYPKIPRGNKRLRRPPALAEEFLAPGLGEFLARSIRRLRHSEKIYCRKEQANSEIFVFYR